MINVENGKWRRIKWYSMINVENGVLVNAID
jgi:hypothetical protein